MHAKGKAVRGRRREEYRPTLARVRDAVFNSLRGRVAGARVLDLYAGSGALGIEALRRGAERAVFVEHDAKLVMEIRQRLTGEELAGRAEVWRRDTLAGVRDLGLAGRAFEIIFLDPPYGRGLIAATLRVIGTAGILAPGGVVAAEGHWRDRPSETGGLVCRREARYGETMVWYFERAGGDTS
jgi:16S rRNA (guanine966-N2)-methyltransferase